MSRKAIELALECKRQSESCLYTSTAFYVWLKSLRWVRGIFAVVPLILGTLAGWKVLTQSPATPVQTFVAIAAFIAGLLPTIYAALKIDEIIGNLSHLAGEFKNLQDRFRFAALVSSKKPFQEFEIEVSILNDRLEKAKSCSMTTPDWCFRRAQKKVKSGDYDFDVDLSDETSG
jgi:hypothetical protein